MSKEKVILFDTTLRDGQQTQGVDFSVQDKVNIAKALDNIGIDYIEGGWPGANPTDTKFFEQNNKFSNAKFTAFGSLIDANSDSICLVAKTWDFHVDLALGISLEENIEAIKDSVLSVKANDKEPLIDCEHFFDGFKSNPEFSYKCIEAAYV